MPAAWHQPCACNIASAEGLCKNICMHGEVLSQSRLVHKLVQVATKWSLETIPRYSRGSTQRGQELGEGRRRQPSGVLNGVPGWRQAACVAKLAGVASAERADSGAQRYVSAAAQQSRAAAGSSQIPQGTGPRRRAAGPLFACASACCV